MTEIPATHVKYNAPDLGSDITSLVALSGDRPGNPVDATQDYGMRLTEGRVMLYSFPNEGVAQSRQTVFHPDRNKDQITVTSYRWDGDEVVVDREGWLRRDAPIGGNRARPEISERAMILTGESRAQAIFRLHGAIGRLVTRDHDPLPPYQI